MEAYVQRGSRHMQSGLYFSHRVLRLTTEAFTPNHEQLSLAFPPLTFPRKEPNRINKYNFRKHALEDLTIGRGKEFHFVYGLFQR